MNNANYECWRLEFIDRNAVKHVVFGSEDVLRQAVDEWKSTLVVDGTGPKLIEVHGHTDTSDRAHATLGVKAEDILAYSVVRMT